MITRTLSLMFLALGLALATPLFSQQDAGSKLGELMGDFQRTTKKLPTLLEDEPRWEQALAEVCRLQKVSIDAKSEVPELVTGIEDEKKRKKARLAYRAKMQEFVRALLDVETALLEENAKAAKKALRELDKLKSDGHGKFKRQW